MRIEVVENQIEAALKALKKRMQKEGLFQEMKRRAHYEKPSVKRKRKQAQAREAAQGHAPAAGHRRRIASAASSGRRGGIGVLSAG